MMRVLFVDDEPDIREIAEMSLMLDPDFEVRTAATGAEALALAGSWKPDIILLDVMMPFMDGPSVLAELRLREDSKHTPVVFVTARAQQSEMQNFATLDAVGVLAKPFDPVTLAARVRAFL